MTYLIAAASVIGAAAFALREPHLRSVRTIALAAAALVLAVVLLSVGAAAAAVVGAVVAVVPLAVVAWFPRLITALPPADYAEHELIGEARAILWRAADLERAADHVLSRFASSPPPAPEWAEVRAAIVDQIVMMRSHAEGFRDVSRDEAQASWTRTVRAWKAAIAARRRFLR